MIQAAGRRVCLRVRINADCPVPPPGCAGSLRRPCNLSHAAKVHVGQSPLSCSPFTRCFLLRAVTTPWKHIFCVDTRLLPAPAAGWRRESKIYGQRDLGCIGRVRILRYCGTGCACHRVWESSLPQGKRRGCYQGVCPPPTETAVHREMFKKSSGEVSSNAKRQDCHLQYNL